LQKERLEKARAHARLSQQERALIKQATHRRIQSLQIYGTQVLFYSQLYALI
jgi:hypothetical protein